MKKTIKDITKCNNCIYFLNGECILGKENCIFYGKKPIKTIDKNK